MIETDTHHQQSLLRQPMPLLSSSRSCRRKFTFCALPIESFLFWSWALMPIIGVIIHATIELNFQIPSNSGYFMAMLALALIAAHKDRQQQ